MAATMAMLNLRFFTITKSSKNIDTCKPAMKAVPFLSLKDRSKRFASFKSPINSITLIPGTIVSTSMSCDPAFGAQQIAEAAEGDKRVLALLIPIIPAILWVLYNILGPALNQINRMRSEKKGVIVGLGLGGLAGSSFFLVPSASASELAMVSEASSDHQGLLLLLLATSALLHHALRPVAAKICNL